MTGAQIPDNLTPYAGGEVSGKSGGGSGRMGTDPIRGADLSVAPYAQEAGNQARDESAKQVGARNTNRGVKGDRVDCGVFTDGNSLQVPGDVTPYAGTSNTSAQRRDAEGQ